MSSGSVARVQSSSLSNYQSNAKGTNFVKRDLIPLCQPFDRSSRAERINHVYRLPGDLVERIFFLTWELSGSPESPHSPKVYGMMHLFNSEARFHEVIRQISSIAFCQLDIVPGMNFGRRMDHYLSKEQFSNFMLNPANKTMEETEKFLEALSSSVNEGLVETLMKSAMGESDCIFFLCPLWVTLSNNIFNGLGLLSSSDRFMREFVEFIAQKNSGDELFDKSQLLDILRKIESKDVDFFKSYFLSDDYLSMFFLNSKKQFNAECVAELKTDFVRYLYCCAFSKAVDPNVERRTPLLLIEMLEFFKSYIEQAEKSQTFNQFTLEGQYNLPSHVEFISLLLQILRADGIDLLSQSPKEFSPLAQSFPSLSPHELFCSAQTTYFVQSTLLTHFYSLWKFGYSIIPQKLIPKQGIEAFKNFHIKKLNEQICSSERISPATQAVLQLLLNRVFNRLTNNYRNTTEIFHQFASGSSLFFFQELFEKKFDSSGYSTLSGERNKKIALEYQEHYENYIPRLKELSSSIHVFSNKNARDLLILRTFSSFLEHGDVEGLMATIAKTDNTNVQDAFFYHSMARFSESSAHLAKERTHQIFERAYQGIEMQCVGAPRMLANLLDAWMFDDSQSLFYLFSGVSARSDFPLPSRPVSIDEQPAPFIGNKKSKNKRKKAAQVAQVGAKSKTIPAQSKPAPIPQPEVNQASVAKALPPISSSQSSSSSLPESEELPVKLKDNRSLLGSWLPRLSQGQADHVVKALKNSSEHFDNLLCSMSCLKSEASRNKLTPQLLFAFVNDCIRYSTLGTEQVLTALYQKSRKVDTELPPRLTHDLNILFQGCSLTADIPYSLCRWIREINRGEIIVRNRKLIPEQDTVLTRLLEANYRLLEMDPNGKDSAQLRAIVFKELFGYLEPLGRFLDAMQDQFLTDKKGKTHCKKELGKGFSDLVSHFCETMSSYPLVFSSTSENPSSKGLSELRSQLEISNSSPLSQMIGELGNVLTNSLLHLEMSVRDDLEPIETSLRLSNALLLNQQIVESVLLHKVHSAGIPTTDEEEYQHDLLGLLAKLGITEDNFSVYFSSEEIEFLKTARACRQLIRYPASFDRLDSRKSRLERIEKYLKIGRRLAASQAAGQDLRGFTPAKGSDKEGLESIKKFIEKDTEIMVSVVKKVLITSKI